MEQSYCIKEAGAAGHERRQEPDLQPPQPRESEIRVEKVLDIRRQLGEGTYSIADRLEVVIERIIEDLRDV